MNTNIANVYVKLYVCNWPQSTVQQLHIALGKMYELERKASDLKYKLEEEQQYLTDREHIVQQHMELIASAKERQV